MSNTATRALAKEIASKVINELKADPKYRLVHVYLEQLTKAKRARVPSRSCLDLVENCIDMIKGEYGLLPTPLFILKPRG